MKRASSRKVGTVELPLEKRPLADLGFVLLMQRGGLQLNRLRELESNGKLSASGFIRASLKFAETDNMQLDMVAKSWRASRAPITFGHLYKNWPSAFPRANGQACRLPRRTVCPGLSAATASNTK